MKNGGAGITLVISQSHTFYIKMGCGHNTNTRVELLALWALMNFAAATGLHSLHVCGDSSVIINWANDEATLSALDLDYWCDNITELKSSFLSLDFRHVYREHNKNADCLSKEVLCIASRLLSFLELYEGVIIGGGMLQLF